MCIYIYTYIYICVVGSVWMCDSILPCIMCMHSISQCVAVHVAVHVAVCVAACVVVCVAVYVAVCVAVCVCIAYRSDVYIYIVMI